MSSCQPNNVEFPAVRSHVNTLSAGTCYAEAEHYFVICRQNEAGKDGEEPISMEAGEATETPPASSAEGQFNSRYKCCPIAFVTSMTLVEL